jgi:probable HAF family extracellular repeat protein
MKDLGALESGYAVAYAINEAGLVVGKSWISTVLSEDYGYSGRPVLWEPGQAIRNLGGLSDGPHNSAAYGINEAGQVVGTSDLGRVPDGVPVQAFLWSAADGMESLFPTTGLTTAQDINNHEQVVGDRRIATLRLVPGNDHPAARTRGSGFYSVPGQGNRKAHFTFDASFPGGGTVPNGSVKFWIPGLEKNFESSSIEFLVVSGNRAQFWGTGTLNGVPARFRITAIDGNAHHDGVADAIRLELWDASGATPLYDTQPGAPQDAPVTTPIDGGNIQIRRGCGATNRSLPASFPWLSWLAPLHPHVDHPSRFCGC